MNLRTTLILAFVFMGLGTLAVFDPFHWKSQQEEGKEREEKVFWLKDKKAEWLEIQAAGAPQPVRIECSLDQGCELDNQGRWKITKPVATLGDPVNIGSLLSGLKSVTAVERIDSVPGADLEEFGLAKPDKIFRMKFKGDAEPLTVKFGAPSAIGANVYLQSSASPGELFLVAKYFPDLFHKESFHWRSKRFYPELGPENVKGMTFTYAGKTTIAAVKQEGSWSLTAPIKARASDGMINGLVGNMLYLNAHNVLAESRKDPAVAKILRGLKPVLTLEFTYADNTKNRIEFFKKNLQAKSTQVEFVAVGGAVDWVGTVDAIAISRYDRKLEEYRDRRALPFTEKEKVAGMVFTFPREKKSITLAISEGEWKRKQGDSVPKEISSPRVQSFLEGLEAAPVKEYVDSPARIAEWKRLPADLELGLIDKDGKSIRAFRFVLEERKRVLATGERPGELLAYEGDFLKSLPVRLLDLDVTTNAQVIAAPPKAAAPGEHDAHHHH